MKSFFLHVSFSDVKKLVASGLLLLGTSSVPMFVMAAETTPRECNVPNNCLANQTPTPAEEFPEGHTCAGFTKKWKCELDCNGYKKELDEAQNAASTACSEASLGTLPKCIAKMKECVNPSVTGGTDGSFMDSIMPIVGQVAGAYTGTQLNMPNTKTVNKGTCANMSYRDYFEQKDRLKKDIETAQKDLNDLKKKMSDAVKDFNEQKADLTKEANEAQKLLAEQKNDLSKEKRQQQADLQAAQSETAEKIRQLNTQLMAKRAEMANTESQFTQKLANMTPALGETKCVAEVTALREELKKIYGSSWAAQSKKTATLDEKFKNCIADFRIERRRLMDQRTSYLTQAQNEIQNIQENISEATQSLESMAKTNQEVLTEMSKRESELTQQATQAIQTAQMQMSDAANNLKQLQTDIAQEQSELTVRITSLNQDIDMLGAAPSSGSTKNWTSAQSAVMTYYTKLNGIPDPECTGSVGTHKKGDKLFKDMEKATKNDGTQK
ncbi:MAG: hypothetical protein KF789_03935 [Bdellovibrionaceae bacterium]|nr:hypothetical protein [Pseudobdellovibrionaceae bacterium]